MKPAEALDLVVGGEVRVVRYSYRYRKGQYRSVRDPIIGWSDDGKPLPEQYREPFVYYNRVYTVNE